jgi:hypothetical protein
MPNSAPLRDDSDLLAPALQVQARFGNLILRRPTYIRGLLYEPGTYVLTHIGPLPPDEESADEGDDW